MSWAVNNLASSLSGTQNAAGVVKKNIDKKKPVNTRRSDRDEYNHVAEMTEVEHTEAVRSLKDNSQEETREDRREHGGFEVQRAVEFGRMPTKPTVYTKAAAIRSNAGRPSRGIDLRG